MNIRDIYYKLKIQELVLLSLRSQVYVVLKNGNNSIKN